MAAAIALSLHSIATPPSQYALKPWRVFPVRKGIVFSCGDGKKSKSLRSAAFARRFGTFSRHVAGNTTSSVIGGDSEDLIGRVHTDRQDLKDSCVSVEHLVSSWRQDTRFAQLFKKFQLSLNAAVEAIRDRQKKLRLFPVLLLGLGVVLSLRPGYAWAGFASEALSPEGKGLLASAWAGLVAGCLHTLTGPDHLAALAPLCIGRSRLQSAAVGALWGCGHDAGQIIFGLIFLLLKDKLHIELIRTWASRVVGLTLITIGGVGIYESQESVQVLEDAAGLQDIGGKQEIRIKNDSKNATTFATGIVYGLQPDALLMILPALALPSRITGAAFLAMFLVGTVLAMGSYTLFLSSCSHALQKRLPGITKNLTLGSSLIAIALGIALVVSELYGVTIF